MGPSSRMEWARREERIMHEERAAQWLANVRGTGVHRRGEFVRP